MNIAIFIYDDAEVLDFSGPFEVFSTANRLSEPRNVLSVFMVAEKKQPVTARGGYQVLPHYGFDEHPKIDVLIVVGGVHHEAVKNTLVINWIKAQAQQTRFVASVCTGAFILAEAGLLKNKTVTTHWEDIKDLRASYPNLEVIENKRWMDEGNLITSGGISAGIDMSLHLLSRLTDQNLAERTARQMEFDWHK